jgi:hypothetical protein
MADVDYGVVFGLAGLIAGLGSVVYARSSASAARRQAEESARVALVEISRDLNERVVAARGDIVGDPVLWEEFRAANPDLAQLYAEARPTILMRNYIDLSQDVFILRKRGIVQDHHWRNWAGSLLVNSRLPTFRRVLENTSQRKLLEPDYEAFLRGLLEGRADDPAGRVTLSGAQAPSPSAKRPS